MPGPISGSFFVLLLYDVSDEIRLEQLRGILRSPPAGRKPPFRHPAPEYVQFSRPPVVEPFGGTLGPKGDSTRGRVAYYEYGVVSLELELPFEGGWQEIIRLAASWMNDPGMERNAGEAVRKHIERAAPALVNRYEQWLTEDYYVIQLNTIVDDRGIPVTADDLIEHCGDSIRSEEQTSELQSL